MAAPIKGIFVNLDAATLATMKAEWTACLSSIAVAHQSYSIAGRTFNRANLAEVAAMVAEISYAQSLKSGTLLRTVYSDMSGT